MSCHGLKREKSCPLHNYIDSLSLTNYWTSTAAQVEFSSGRIMLVILMCTTNMLFLDSSTSTQSWLVSGVLIHSHHLHSQVGKGSSVSVYINSVGLNGDKYSVPSTDIALESPYSKKCAQCYTGCPRKTVLIGVFSNPGRGIYGILLSKTVKFYLFHSLVSLHL